MTIYRYRLLNVFAIDGDKFSGNPLCVFEDARGLDTTTMQALALQFNLSETTFILSSDKATARVRIFTPNFEMPFAGHPTLGTAHVVHELGNTDDTLSLEMQVGVIPVKAHGNTWTLQANAPVWRSVTASHTQLAEMLDIAEADLGEQPLWVNTGSEQLVIPLRSKAAVDRCQPRTELLQRYGRVNGDRFLVYVWSDAGNDEIAARFFFAKGNACAEDPATGSACTNLGGWFVATQMTLPLRKRVRQGDAVGRPSALALHVSAAKDIFVSGNVVELGCGTVDL